MHKYESTGSCCTLVMVRQEGDDRVVYNANVDDSAAVLGKADTGEKISGWHHVDNDDEYDRVEAKQMNVFMDRLGGVLLVT